MKQCRRKERVKNPENALPPAFRRFPGSLGTMIDKTLHYCQGWRHAEEKDLKRGIMHTNKKWEHNDGVWGPNLGQSRQLFLQGSGISEFMWLQVLVEEHYTEGQGQRRWDDLVEDDYIQIHRRQSRDQAQSRSIALLSTSNTWVLDVFRFYFLSSFVTLLMTLPFSWTSPLPPHTPYIYKLKRNPAPTVLIF